MLGAKKAAAGGGGPVSPSVEQFILFENEKKRELKERLEQLPSAMENPYVVLKRFIKWEKLDLEAVIGTIESKNAMYKRRAAL